MAKTSKRTILAALTRLIEKSDNPRIQIEATKLVLILRSEGNKKKANLVDPELAELIGLNDSKDKD